MRDLSICNEVRHGAFGSSSGDGSAAADVRTVLICEHRPESPEDGGFVEQVDVESLVAGSSVVDHGSGVVDLEVLDAALLDGGYRRTGDVEAEAVAVWPGCSRATRGSRR